MRVYVYRDKGSKHIRVSRICPHRYKDGRYNPMHPSMFGMGMVAFRKHFGFTVRPGTCMSTDLFIEEYGEAV